MKPPSLFWLQFRTLGIVALILIAVTIVVWNSWNNNETNLSIEFKTSTSTADLRMHEDGVGIMEADTPKASLTSTQFPTLVGTATTTSIPEIEQTPEATQSTKTRSTPSPSPGPLLDTPFGPSEMYLVHKVDIGESLLILAERYQTNIEVIKKINRFGGDTVLMVDQVVVVMPGVNDPSEVEPLISILVQDETTLSSVASQFRVDEAEVRFYNDLGRGDSIPGGRWLVIPVREATPTYTLTPTASPTRDRSLTEPFGPGNMYVIHKVEAGESFALLENIYSTSEEVIRYVNQFEFGLWEGQVFVILPNQTDPTGLIPLRVLQIEEQVSVEDLAISLEIDLSELLYHNGLTEGTLLLPGQWIVYPVRSGQE